MTKRSTTLSLLLAAAFLSLCLPMLASAQGRNDPWWGRDRRNDDYRRDDDYYRRDRRRDDDYYGRGDRYLRDSVRRVKNASRDFQKRVDRELDRGRYDDTRYEDRANDVAKEFRKAAEELEDRFDDGRDLRRSEQHARRLIQAANRIDRVLSRTRGDSSLWSQWSSIRHDLNVIADAYGLHMDDYRNDDYNRRGRARFPSNGNGDRPWWLPRF